MFILAEMQNGLKKTRNLFNCFVFVVVVDAVVVVVVDIFDKLFWYTISYLNEIVQGYLNQ